MTYTSIYALGVALALAASPALAQSSSSPSSTQRSPSATSPSGSSSAPSRTSMPSDIQSMKAGDLVGKAVYDDKGERIGEVDEVVQNKTNKQAAAVIGVGGFLGIGERKAAVPLNQLKVQGDKIVGTGLTKDSVKSMAEYKDSDSDQWDKMDRDRMLSEASSGASGSSPATTGSSTTSPSGSSTGTSGSSTSGSSSMPSGTSGTSGSTSSPGTATGSPSTSPSSPSGSTSPSGSSSTGSSTGSSSSMGSSSSGSSSGAAAKPDNATPTEKK